jgi:hypothetical protein
MQLIALIFFGFASTKQFSSSDTEDRLLWVQLHAMLPKVDENFPKVLNMITLLLATHHYIIHICRDIPIQLCPEECLHCSIEGAPCVPEPLQHSNKAIHAEGHNESGLVFIRLPHPDLVISRETIKHAHHF